MPTHPMNPELASVYRALRIEVTWLHARWITYSQLFSHSEARIDLLNECARSHFHFIHEVLLNDLLLALCKLTDPAIQGKNENLSMERLQRLLEATGDPLLAKECEATLNGLETFAAPMKVLRNKQLAHLDLAVALEEDADPLPPIAKAQIGDALGLLRKYLNAVELHYNDSEWGYEHFLMTGSDSNALVNVLRDGLRYEQLVREEVISYEDHLQSPWRDA